jgi:hypothetical protein
VVAKPITLSSWQLMGFRFIHPTCITGIMISVYAKHLSGNSGMVSSRSFSFARMFLAASTICARAVDEIHVYNAEIAKIGQWTFQLHLNYATDGNFTEFAVPTRIPRLGRLERFPTTSLPSWLALTTCFGPARNMRPNPRNREGQGVDQRRMSTAPKIRNVAPAIRAKVAGCCGTPSRPNWSKISEPIIWPTTISATTVAAPRRGNIRIEIAI